MIRMTSAAEAHFEKLLRSGQSVLLGTKHSGCSGLKYCLAIKSEFDAVLYEKLDTKAQIAFWVEKKSLAYLKDLVIDWVTEGLQSRIVYNNPQETAKCGCGESFSVSKHED